VILLRREWVPAIGLASASVATPGSAAKKASAPEKIP
jgi:hypothetical protein